MAFLLALVALAPARAQGIVASETFNVGPADTAVVLAHRFIVPGTLSVQIDGVQFSVDPGLDLTAGLFVFDSALRAALRAPRDSASGPARLHVRYGYRPIVLPPEYARRRLVTVTDSSGGSRVVAQPAADLSSTSIFGRNFQRSGSIVRGFTVGSNRDLTLESGLRLQFSGMVTDDVEVLGALTDEQTPIQPEGNTQTLREVDNIFMEIRSKYAGATLGKFIAGDPLGGYLAFSRKLQGVKATARYGTLGSTEVVAAVAPGRFHTQSFTGRERDQGPYRLAGQNNERDIIVVAGSERVFVDGVQMVRGEREDYVIDYATGEIFFRQRRPITGLSRIVVDFEYTDRQYSRSFVSITNTGHLFDGALTVSAGYVREADNQDATVDITLDDADRSLLARAGGDRSRAYRSGAVFVGRSDSLSGAYVRVDTVIDGRPDSVFRYAPDDPAAVYNVTFSVPPAGVGDYRYVAFGQYEFAGKGAGAYLPVVYLPLPQLHQVAAIRLRSRPARWATVNAEAAYSATSLNRFSDDPSAVASGAGLNLDATISGDSIDIAGARLGAARLEGRVQFVGGGFRAVERIGDADFSNRWNAGERPGQTGGDNVIAEAKLTLVPVRRLELVASAGYLRQTGVLRSLRGEYGVRFLGDTTLPSADYTFESISYDTATAQRQGLWLRQRGGISVALGVLRPGLRAEWEQREDRAGTADTLLPVSFRALEAGPDLAVVLPFMSTTARARFRVEDSARIDPAGGAAFLRDGTAATYSLRGELRGVRDLTSTIDVTYRRRRYEDVPGLGASARLDNTTLLARTQTRWTGLERALDLDALYEVQTQQAARLQRLFVKVPFGRGEYTWSDYDGDGRQTEDEFRLATLGDGEYVRFDVPTEQLYPVIDLRASFRLRAQPRRLFDPVGTWGRLLSPVTAETYLFIEEKSQSQRESDIYLLRFSAFQSDSTTLSGAATIQQDVNLFEGNPEYSFRLRYLGRYGLTRLVSTIERTESAERTLRVRWQPTFDIGLQFDLGFNRGLLRSTDTASARRFDLSSVVVANDFSYRPEKSLELGWLLKLSTSSDVALAVERTTLLNTNALRAVYSIETRGRLRAEIERTNVSGRNIGDDPLALPYQLTDGFAIGTTWTARAALEYRFGANIQASITYTGRAQPPTLRVIHIGQAEVRAFF